MKRGLLGLVAMLTLFASVGQAQQRGPYYRVRQQPPMQNGFDDQFDLDFDEYDSPGEPAPPTARRNGANGSNGAPVRGREMVGTPEPFEHVHGHPHHGHHYEGQVWPEYYGPPYGGLGYDPCAPLGKGWSPCGRHWPIWGQFDYLMWWGKGGHYPPLVTTSPPGTPAGDAGVLDEPGTRILFGDERLDSRMRSGGRLNVGMWFDECEQFGVGGSFFAIGRIGTNYDPVSDGSIVLARPFYNVETGLQDSELVSYPEFLAGNMAVRTSNYVFGAEAYFRESLRRECDRRLDAIYGYRFMRMDESLHIDDTAISIEDPSIIPLGTSVAGSEYFLTRNSFHGAQFGLWYQSMAGRWGWDILGKIALGTVRQSAYVNGQTVVTVPGVGSEVQPGSLLALPTNIGSYTRNQFSVIPEVQINITRHITDNLRARFGYTFMLMSEVAQVGRQLDLGVNPTQIGGDPLVGPARPAFEFQNTNYWLQGINFGLEFSY